MANFLILTKTFFLSGFNVNKKKGSQRPIFQKLAILGFVFLMFSTLYGLLQFWRYTEEGKNPGEVLLFLMAISSFLIIILTFNQMQGNIFASHDYEFVSSLPVSKVEVVAARIASILLICIAEDLIILLPSCIIYGVVTKNIFGMVISIISAFLVSLLPLLVSTVLGTLVALFTKKLKNKNIFQVIIYLAYFVVVFMVSFSINNSNIVQADKMLNIMPHLRLYENALYNSDLGSFLLFVALNVGAFILVVLLVSLLYTPINAMQSNYGAGGYKDNGKGIYSLEKALFHKEIKMVTQNANYLVNAFFGAVICPIIAIMTMVVNFAPNAPAEAAAEVARVFVYLIPLYGIVMNCASTSTSASISLEKGNFELLCSYPIRPIDIIKAKLKVGYMIPAIVNLIGSSVIIVVAILLKKISFSSDWPLIIEVFIIPQLACLYTACVGLLCNLRWPKLNFENEVQVIKNSQSALYTMLICFIPAFIIGGINFGLSFISSVVSLILTTILLIVMVIIAYSLLKKNGEKLFNLVMSR